MLSLQKNLQNLFVGIRIEVTKSTCFKATGIILWRKKKLQSNCTVHFNNVQTHCVVTEASIWTYWLWLIEDS